MKHHLRTLGVCCLTLGLAGGLMLHGGGRDTIDAQAAQSAAGAHLDDPILLDVRGVFDEQRIALAFTWASNKPHAGVLHDIRGYSAEKRSWDRPRPMNEDRISFMLEDPSKPVVDFATMGCYVTCHADLNGMPENTEDTRHYIDKAAPGQGTMLDMWHWRGARSGPMGYAEDTWVRAHEFGTGAQGRRRDDGAGFTTTTLREGGDRLREDMAFGVEITLGDHVLVLPEYVFDPERNSGFFFLNDGAELILAGNAERLWDVLSVDAMEAGRLQHALIATGQRANSLHVPSMSLEQQASLVAQIRDGVLIPRPVLFDYPSDQHDIQAQRHFNTSSRSWTVTMIRDLTTGSPNDVCLADLPGGQTYALAAAIHDSNDSRVSHQISVPLTMGTQETGADIVLAKVTDVTTVDWSGVPALETLTFKPGTTTLQHLVMAHDVVGADMRSMRCQGCHTEPELADLSRPFLLK